MRKLVKLCLPLFIIVFAMISLQTRGQAIPELLETSSSCDSREARYMWAQLNDYRRLQKLQPLAMSTQLCQVADIQALDLASRPALQIGNMRARNSAEGEIFLDDWLDEIDYARYGETEMLAALSPYVLADLAPLPGEGAVDFISYMMARLNDEHLYSNALNIIYREIGISYHKTANRHVYVFIFGSQPDVLPIIPIAPDYLPVNNLPYEYAYRWNRSTDVGLLFLNERFAPSGYSADTIGAVTYVRRADDAENEVDCPRAREVLENAWETMPLTDVRPYPLELVDRIGVQTIYFQMCDAAGHSIINSVTLDYPGSFLVTTTPGSAISDSAEDEHNASATAQLNQQNEVFAIQTQDSIFATQNSRGLFATEFLITQTEQAIHLLATDIAETQSVLDSRDSMLETLAETSTAIAELQHSNEAIIADVRATRAIATPVPTLTPAPTQFPDTPMPTFTPVTTLPFPQLNFYWRAEDGMFVVYNPNITGISFDVLSRFTFRAEVEDRVISYSLAQTVDRARSVTSATALISHGCMLIQDLQDNIDISLEDVQTSLGECDEWNFLSAEDAIPSKDVFWGAGEFDVYYNSLIVNTCPASASGVVACILQAQVRTGEVNNTDTISVVTNPTAVPTRTPQPNIVPSLNIRLAWSVDGGFFVLINMSDETLPLVDLQALTFTSLDSDAEYGVFGLVNRVAGNGVTDFMPGRCMMVQIIDDGKVPDESDVANFRGECDASDEFTAEDSIGVNTIFWLDSGFEVTYNDILVTTCATNGFTICDVP